LAHKRSPAAEARRYVKNHVYYDINNKEMISLTSSHELTEFLSIIFEHVDFSKVPDLYSNGEPYDIRGTVVFDTRGTGSFQLFDEVWR
jgi:hypothetical protein